MTDSRENPTDGSPEPRESARPTPSSEAGERAQEARPDAAPATASDAPQPPQTPPGPPQPPTQAPAAQVSQPQAAARAYEPPTSRYAPPTAAPASSNYASAPTPGGQQPYPFGQNPYQRPAQQTAPTQPHAAGADGSGTNGSGNADKPAKRNAPLGLVAALAIGALVGGVSGAGVTAIALNASQAGQAPSSASTPANITVNDGADATVITAVAAAAGPSVVTISVSDGSSGSGGTGSGVILSDDGYVLTNTHVVTLDGASAQPTVTVQTADGRLFKADVVGTDPISDLAVIKIQGGSDFQPAEFADSDDLNVGDTAVAIGAPLGLANTVTNGIVSSLNRSITVASSAAPETEEEAPDPNDDNGGDGPFDFWQFGTPDPQQQTQASSTIALSVIQTDAAINPGNSGGALLDSDGKVIGINVAIASAGSGSSQSASGSIGVGFAIPSNLAKRISSEIIESGTGSHGLLGANVNDVTDPDATVVGAAIQEVTAGGAAQAAGLRAGDIVTKVDDIPITGRTDLTAQIRALAAGAETTLTYVRDGDVGTVDVTLGSLS